MFDWPDAVVHVRPDGSDVEDVLCASSAEPERVRQIARRNAQEALLRHDWIHRWRRIFEIAGLAARPPEWNAARRPCGLASRELPRGEVQR